MTKDYENLNLVTLLKNSSSTESKNENNILNSTVHLRGFVSGHRIGKSVSFIVVRQGVDTIQCVYSKKDFKELSSNLPDLSEELENNLKIDAQENKNIKDQYQTLNNANQVKDENEVTIEENPISKSAKKKAEKKMLKSERKNQTKSKKEAKTFTIYDYYNKITLESFVEIKGLITYVDIPIKSSTISNLEIQIQNISVLSSADDLPFSLKDVFPTKSAENELSNENQKIINVSDDKKSLNANKNDTAPTITVSIGKLLDNRSLSLRHTPTQNLFRTISMFYSKITSYLMKNKFVQIKTPKLIESSSEGGANLFNVQFFNRTACLAQSPQLYKQMAILGGLERVFEIGHVYRAEESNNNRYLSEFIGIDLEMEIDNLDKLIGTVWSFIASIFDAIKSECSEELLDISKMFGKNAVEYNKTPLVFTFEECKNILYEYENTDSDEFASNKNESGVDYSDIRCGRSGCMCDKTPAYSEYESTSIHLQNCSCEIKLKQKKDAKMNMNDFSREEERILGSIIYEKYQSDLFCIKKYPTACRAFYTKPMENKVFSYSYDFILRGEEILSGAIRINDYNELIQAIKRCEISEESLKGYLDSFRIGAPQHGGCGIGFERMLKQFFGGKDIRLFTMFPRDPTRLYP